MGLLYVFPVDKNEPDHTLISNDQSLTLKSYGLPYIFWFYMFAIDLVIFFLWLAVRSSFDKMLTHDDHLGELIVMGTKAIIMGIPLTLLGFFFFEKILVKKQNNLTIIYKIFFMQWWKKTYELKSPDAFSLNHFIDSPNVAKLQSQSEMVGFQNKGYFEMHALLANDKKLFVDRHSIKAYL
jgi:hypothetical protein